MREFLDGRQCVMTRSSPAGSDADESTGVAGSSTDQDVTGTPETGDFTTDREPGYSPVEGSSNAGVNATGGNRIDPEDRDAAGEEEASA
jgi:hypothetical protein